MKLWQKTIILLSIPLIFETVFVSVLVQATHQAEQEFLEEANNREISICVNRMMRDMLQSATQLGTRYLVRKDNVQLSAISDLLVDIREQQEVLKGLLGDDQAKQQQFENFNAALDSELVTVSEFQKMMAGKHDLEAILVLRRLNSLLTTINEEGSNIIDKYDERGEERRQAIMRSRRRIRQIILVGAILNIMLVAGLGYWALKNTLNRLTILMKNNERLAMREPLLEPVPGNDEIAQLDVTFHKMAQALDDARLKEREFVSMISHDIRSPLAGLQLTLELFAEETFGKISSQGHTGLSMSLQSIARILSIADGLLNLDKLETGNFVLQKERCSIQDLITEAISHVQSLAAAKEVLLLNGDAEPISASLDQTQMVRVLINLISNAIKFSSAGGQVIVSARRETDRVVVKVTDNGRGIPEDKLGTIFERYGQVEATDATEKRGIGLGLPICKAIVQAHEGDIGVQSVEGKGATFWFSVPFAEDSK